jgi:hypothetical protein
MRRFSKQVKIRATLSPHVRKHDGKHVLLSLLMRGNAAAQRCWTALLRSGCVLATCESYKPGGAVLSMAGYRSLTSLSPFSNRQILYPISGVMYDTHKRKRN